MRTKYEPDVEKEEASFEKKAAKLPSEKAQVNNTISGEMLAECCMLQNEKYFDEKNHAFLLHFFLTFIRSLVKNACQH